MSARRPRFAVPPGATDTHIDWPPDETAQERILVRNPAGLYGFIQA